MKNISNSQSIRCLLLFAGWLVCGYTLGANDKLAPAASSYQRSEAAYEVPDVMLVRQDGKKVSLKKELNDGRPVFLNFIYASCTTLCPVLSHVFSKTQEQLGKERDKVHLVSISLDPENDTPAKLIEYGKKFKAGAHWQHYTGTKQDSVTVQKAFDAYRGDKMNHTPTTFLRASPGKAWVRLDGFLSPDDLIREYHNLIKPE